MEFNIEKLEQSIIDKVSEEIIGNIDLSSAISSRVEKEMDKRITAGVGKALDGILQKALDDGFDHAYTPVDTFGRPSGETTTIRQQLERQVNNYWTERVDKNGKKTDSSYSSISRAEYIMLTVAADGFSNEMKQHMVQIGSHLKDSLRSELRKTLDQLLTEVFHVKSLGDQNKSEGERNSSPDMHVFHPAAQ
jgi:hypothetical protein